MSLENDEASFAESMSQMMERRRQQALLDVSEESNRAEFAYDESISNVQQPHYRDKQFTIHTYMKNHPNESLTSVCNFDKQQLHYLKSLLPPKLGRSGSRNIGAKSRIFIALYHFCTNSTFKEMELNLNVPHATIAAIVKECIDVFFPIWESRFIPSMAKKNYSEVEPPKHKFINFPWCVGAIDTTTVAHVAPKSKSEKAASWDAKNRCNGRKLECVVNPDGKAIWVCADFEAGTHDFRIYKESGVQEFFSDQSPTGIKVIQPLLADRGYTGMKNFSPNSEVMLRGEGAEEINTSIAQDRSIVERWNSRFKQNWGMMHDVYRGDRRELKKIMLGVAALTNYHIDLHPLDDPIKYNEKLKKLLENPRKMPIIPEKKMTRTKTKKAAFSSKSSQESYNKDDYIPNVSILVPKDAAIIHQLPIAENIVGLINQGTTCHINVSLQLLFSIQDFKTAVYSCASICLRPSMQLSQIFHIMEIPEQFKGAAISTTKLTEQLGNAKYLPRRVVEDTMFDIVESINQNTHEIISITSLDSLFNIITPNGNTMKYLIMLPRTSSIHELLYPYIQDKDNDKFLFPQNLIILCGRAANLDLSSYTDTPRYNYPDEIDLCDYSANENGRYHLAGIVGYMPDHYVFFKKQQNNWIMINDQHAFFCTQDHIDCLRGGTSEQTSALWNALDIPCIASLLWYSI